MFKADLSASTSQKSETLDGLDAEITAEDIVQQAIARLDLEARRGFGPRTGARWANANVHSSFADHGQARAGLSGIADLPPARLHALQEWEGYVVEIGDDDFTARLTDLTAGASYEREEAVIPLIQLSDGDAAKMREGSVFRWVIGYERSAAGARKRFSVIVFRDLGALTEADLRAGEAWARETLRSFGL